MQNKTHSGVVLFFLSDPPAVIVVAKMIIQDVCKRKRSGLIWVLLAFSLKLFFLLVYLQRFGLNRFSKYTTPAPEKLHKNTFKSGCNHSSVDS